MQKEEWEDERKSGDGSEENENDDGSVESDRDDDEGCGYSHLSMNVLHTLKDKRNKGSYIS